MQVELVEGRGEPIGRDWVESLLRLLITPLLNSQRGLTTHLRGGTDRVYMNSNSEKGLASEYQFGGLYLARTP